MSLESRLAEATDEITTAGLKQLLQDASSGVLVECLDDGFIKLVDYMGGDAAVVQAARVSYGAGTKTVSDDRGLIRYLMRQWHTTPFEMAEFKFLVRIPMDAWRQMVRHRTASINEYSTRYSEAIDSAQTTGVDEWRLQASSNKQGSSGGISDWPDGWRFEALEEGLYELRHNGRSMFAGIDLDFTPGDYLSRKEGELQWLARRTYEERIGMGVAREQARKDLPLSTYTEAYWKVDLHNLLHFLRLRMDSHAQLEIRTYANAIAELIKPIVPHTWEAFNDYRLQSMQLTRLDIELIRTFTGQGSWQEIAQSLGMSKREIAEFEVKANRLNFVLTPSSREDFPAEPKL